MLEDERRQTKVKGETRIPDDRYRVRLHTEGSWHARMQKKFPGLDRGMLHLVDVPGFEWILIHPGNTEKDTAGCLLPGLGALVRPDGEFEVGRSTEAYLRLYEKVVPELRDGAEVWIEVTSR